MSSAEVNQQGKTPQRRGGAELLFQEPTIIERCCLQRSVLHIETEEDGADV